MRQKETEIIVESYMLQILVTRQRVILFWLLPHTLAFCNASQTFVRY